MTYQFELPCNSLTALDRKGDLKQSGPTEFNIALVACKTPVWNCARISGLSEIHLS